MSETNLNEAEHAHCCASLGYPDHAPSAYCICVCGERFDGRTTHPGAAPGRADNAEGDDRDALE